MWKRVYKQVIERSGEPVPSFQDDHTIKLICFIKVNKGNLLVIQTSTKGSGGLTGYKVYGLKNNKYVVIMESLQLNHGIISIKNNKIQEITDIPIFDDPNCCATYKKYKEITFDDKLNPISNEVRKLVNTKAQNKFSKLKDKYPYLYHFNNNGQTVTPTTFYHVYNFNNKETYISYAEYKSPSWSGVSIVILQEYPYGFKELLAIPYTKNRGRWQKLSVQNMGMTIKLSGDLGKVDCNEINCKTSCFDYYDYNPESNTYELTNYKICRQNI